MLIINFYFNFDKEKNMKNILLGLMFLSCDILATREVVRRPVATRQQQKNQATQELTTRFAQQQLHYLRESKKYLNQELQNTKAWSLEEQQLISQMFEDAKQLLNRAAEITQDPTKATDPSDASAEADSLRQQSQDLAQEATSRQEHLNNYTSTRQREVQAYIDQVAKEEATLAKNVKILALTRAPRQTTRRNVGVRG